MHGEKSVVCPVPKEHEYSNSSLHIRKGKTHFYKSTDKHSDVAR